jgi:plastocyanin
MTAARNPVAVAIALAVLLVALAGGAAPVGAQAPHGGHGPSASHVTPVAITFDAVLPEHLEVLAGDTVRWTNESVRAHTVTADDESFDSGRMAVGAQFSRRFDAPSVVQYHCTLHPFIRGVVDVHPLLLARPQQAATPGRAFPLSGRTMLAPGTQVTIQADHGAGFVGVANVPVERNGTFVTTVVPRTTATYRAVADGLTSPTVTLIVLDRAITLEPQRGKRRVLIRTRVAPAAAGAPVVLQLYLRERFGWWPVQRGRLDARSRARFALRTRRRVAARVVLTLPDGATPLAISRTVRLGPVR